MDKIPYSMFNNSPERLLNRHPLPDPDLEIDNRIREGIITRYLQMVAERSKRTSFPFLKIIASDVTAAIQIAGSEFPVSQVTALAQLVNDTDSPKALTSANIFPFPEPFDMVVYDDRERHIDSPNLTEPIRVTPMESSILTPTISRPGRVVFYQEIIELANRRLKRYEGREGRPDYEYRILNTEVDNLRTHATHLRVKMIDAIRGEEGFSEALNVLEGKANGYVAFPLLIRPNRVRQ